jgi:tRNA(Arg) A34 adenosine deaminase TadA
MCFAAIAWARLGTLVFAATRHDAAAPGVDFSDAAIYAELAKPYHQRSIKTYQATTDISLDAFNLWKRSPKTPY